MGLNTSGYSAHFLRIFVTVAAITTIHTQDYASFCSNLQRENGLYVHPTDCSMYISCYDQISTIQHCPKDLLFDMDSQFCDYPHNVKKCENLPPTAKPAVTIREPRLNPPAGEGPVHVQPAQDNEEMMQDTVHSDIPDPSQARLLFSGTIDQSEMCSINGYYADPADCNHYILCHFGQRYVTMCPKGTFYNPKTNNCGYDPEACKQGVTPAETRPPTQGSSQGSTHGSTQGSTRGSTQASTRADKMTTTQPKPEVDLNSMLVHEQMNVLGDALVEAMEDAGHMVHDMMRMEAEAAAQPGENEFSGVSAFLGGTELTKAMGMPAEQQNMAVKMVAEKFDMDKDETMHMMNQFTDLLEPSSQMVEPDMPNPEPVMGECPYASNTADNLCDGRNKYRSIDGSCNNLKRPLWGKSFRPFQRFLQPDYADGINKPRVAKNAAPLPSPRLVMKSLIEDRNRPSFVHTLITMTFGQMIDHDLTRTAVSKLTTDTGALADVKCGSDGCQTEGAENRACLPILVPKGDPDFGNKTCLMFVRTQEVPRDECELGPREQLNQLTSYLDNSHVYGSTAEELHKLRDTSNTDRGRLRVMRNKNPDYKPLLPQDTNAGEECLETSSPCFLAGDGRVNEQIGLTALQTVWHRFHNVMENRLHKINPEWSGEKLFQETRKITIAVWHNIIYTEWLPVILGKQSMRQFGLDLAKDGFHNAYDSSVNAEPSNAFATAAFRFAHSLIDTLVSFTSGNYEEEKYLELSSVLRRPGKLYDNSLPGGSGVDSVLLGQISHPCQHMDQFFTREITAKLFSKNPPHGLGMDLPSINIQRGRDHGIPGYTAWREWCGLSKPNTFDEFVDSSAEARESFRKVYGHVDDVDLFAGGISERLVPGGVTGPTFACIIGRQFRNVRVGDRFWFEQDDPITGFSKAQLKEIRRMSLARLFCDTTDNIKKVQKYVMLQPMSKALEGLESMEDVYQLSDLYRGDNNERKPCSEIPQMDFSVFKE